MIRWRRSAWVIQDKGQRQHAATNRGDGRGRLSYRSGQMPAGFAEGAMPIAMDASD